MKDNKDVEKLRTFITTLSSVIVLVILVGVFATVLIYHSFITNLADAGVTNLELFAIMIGLANTVGIGYLITQVLRVQAGINEIKNKN